MLAVAYRLPFVGSTVIDGKKFASWTFRGSWKITADLQWSPPSVERDTTTLLPVNVRPFVVVSPQM